MKPKDATFAAPKAKSALGETLYHLKDEKLKDAINTHQRAKKSREYTNSLIKAEKQQNDTDNLPQA